MKWSKEAAMHLRRAKTVLIIVGVCLLAFVLMAVVNSTMSKTRGRDLLLSKGLRQSDVDRIIKYDSRLMINSDYRNRDFFYLLRMNEQEFNEFVRSNKMEAGISVQGMPRKGARGSQWVPKWWRPEGECFTKLMDREPRYFGAVYASLGVDGVYLFCSHW
jgi:hypothetical protein